jgi:hypothetical protein
MSSIKLQLLKQLLQTFKILKKEGQPFPFIKDLKGNLTMKIWKEKIVLLNVGLFTVYLYRRVPAVNKMAAKYKIAHCFRQFSWGYAQEQTFLLKRPLQYAVTGHENVHECNASTQWFPIEVKKGTIEKLP